VIAISQSSQIAIHVVREGPTEVRVEKIGQAEDDGRHHPPGTARRPQAGLQRQQRQHQGRGHQEQCSVGQVAEGLHQPDAEGRQPEAREGGSGDFAAPSAPAPPRQ
jgi:rare lipoprotein A (peptidoglycan hydrolase)